MVLLPGWLALSALLAGEGTTPKLVVPEGATVGVAAHDGGKRHTLAFHRKGQTPLLELAKIASSLSGRPIVLPGPPFEGRAVSARESFEVEGGEIRQVLEAEVRALGGCVVEFPAFLAIQADVDAPLGRGDAAAFVAADELWRLARPDALVYAAQRLGRLAPKRAVELAAAALVDESDAGARSAGSLPVIVVLGSAARVRAALRAVAAEDGFFAPAEEPAAEPVALAAPGDGEPTPGVQPPVMLQFDEVDGTTTANIVGLLHQYSGLAIRVESPRVGEVPIVVLGPLAVVEQHMLGTLESVALARGIASIEVRGEVVWQDQVDVEGAPARAVALPRAAARDAFIPEVAASALGGLAERACLVRTRILLSNATGAEAAALLDGVRAAARCLAIAATADGVELSGPAFAVAHAARALAAIDRAAAR